MNDLLGFLIGLVCLLSVLGIFGYGLWAIARKLFHSFVPPARGRQPAKWRPARAWNCPRCAWVNSAEDHRCAVCDLDRDSPAASDLADLATTERQLYRFAGAGVLDVSTLERLAKHISVERQSLVVPRAPRASRAIANPLPLATPPRVEVHDLEAIPEVLPAAGIADFGVLPLASRPAADRERRSEASASRPVVPKAPVDLPTPASPEPPPAPPAPVREPRRPLAELFTAFLEERNILWGELLGGVLMVGGSIALVIYLWTTLAQVPYFPFLIVSGITSGLFGVGLYALHRLQLQTTGRTLLVIATLLVPLSFLVMARLLKLDPTPPWQGGEEGGIGLRIGAEVLVLSVFAALLTVSARVLAPGASWPFTIAVLGSSASLLLSARLLDSESPGWFSALIGGIPVTCFALATAAILRRYRKADSQLAADVPGLFFCLSPAFVAVVIALGFQVYHSGSIDAALRDMAAHVAVTGIPLAIAGAVVHCRLAAERRHGGWRTAGTGLALFGTLIMLAAVALSWPEPSLVMCVCLLDFLALTVIAWHFRLSVAQGVAIACLAAAYLTGCHWLAGNLGAGTSTNPLRLIVAFPSGPALALFAGLFWAAGEALHRFGRGSMAHVYAGASAIAVLVSLFLVTAHGIEAPFWAAGTLAGLATAVLGLNARWRQAWVTGIGLALALAALGWTLRGTLPNDLAWWATALALTGLVLSGVAAVIAARATNERLGESGPPTWRIAPFVRGQVTSGAFLGRPLLRVAGGAGLAALAVAVWAAWWATPDLRWQPATVVTTISLTPLFLMLAGIERHPVQARIAGLMTLLAVVVGVGWASQHGLMSDAGGKGALALAVTGLALASLAVWAWDRHSLPRLAPGWLESAAVGACLALALVVLHPAFPASETCTIVPALTAATLFLMAWHYKSSLLTWLGCGLVLAGIGHACWWIGDVTAPRPLLLLTLLFHALLLLTASTALKRTQRVPALFARTFRHAAFGSALLAIPCLLTPQAGQLLAHGAYACWLGAIWLVLAWTARRPLMFAVFQATLLLAVVFGISSWLEGQSWVRATPSAGWFDPRSLQAYGIGLAGWGLLWILLRMVTRGWQRLQGLLEPQWPALDRVLLGALVIGQLGLALWGIAPEAVREVTPQGMPAWSWPASSIQALGPGAWLLLGSLAGLLTVALCERVRPAVILGLLVLLVTVAVLAAGQYAGELAVASALCWGQGCCFLVGAALLWLRKPLHRGAARIGCRIQPAGNLSAQARRLLIGTSVALVLSLTLVSAILRFAGLRPTGPVDASFFAQIGTLVSSLVPLVLIVIGLVGFGVRERSPGYAFAAGLLANIVLMGGYALGVMADGTPLATAEIVRLLQLGTLGAAVWSLGWLASRRWLSTWREDAGRAFARPLMTVQLGMALVGLALVLGPPVLGMALPFKIRLLSEIVPPLWGQEAGSWLGWSGLAFTVTAIVLRVQQSGAAVAPRLLGWTGLAIIGLLACWLEARWPGAGYRCLMLGSAGGCLAWALAAMRTRLNLRGMPAWVAIYGTIAVLLAIQAAWINQDFLWAAVATALASPAAAIMAVRQRREDWAFAGALGLNLAASLLVLHLHAVGLLTDWFMGLVQANLIASATGALLWLALRRQLYGSLELSLRTSPLLGVQVALAQVGNLALLTPPVFILLLTADGAAWPSYLDDAGHFFGWVAFLLASVAGYWYAVQVLRRPPSEVLIANGVLLGILLACSAHALMPATWLPYYVWVAAWSLTCVGVLAVGWAGNALRLAAWLQTSEVCQTSEVSPSAFGLPRFREVRRWLEALGCLVVCLALRAVWIDPLRPIASIAAVCLIGAAATGMALWSGRRRYIYASGLLIILVGVLVWLVRPGRSMMDLVLVTAMGLAVASIFWSVLEVALRSAIEGISPAGRSWLFRQLATISAIGLLGMVVGLGIACTIAGSHLGLTGVLPWSAWLALLVAVVLGLRDGKARLAQLYVVGLLAIGLWLPNAIATDLAWFAAVVLAPYVLVCSVLARSGVRRFPLMPNWVARESVPWFLPAQLALGALAAALSVWIAMHFDDLAARLAGPAVMALLIVALGLQVRAAGGQTSEVSSESCTFPGGWGRLRKFEIVPLRCLVLALVVLGVAEAAWAALGPGASALAIHRQMALVAALGGMTATYALVLPRLRTWLASWTDPGRRMWPWLLAGTTGLALVVFVQEVVTYDPNLRRTVMAGWAILTMALTMAGLFTAALVFALRPAADPLRLTAGWRTSFVYAAELLLVLLFWHLRLTMPWLFPQISAGAWPFLIMAIAFVGVGLSEWLQRRGLAVLAQPLWRTGLFLSVLPVVAFWLCPLAKVLLGYAAELRGLVPLLTYLARMPQRFDSYALLWFLLALVLTFLSATRRSFWYGLLAALAANVGLWALLYHYEWAFLLHPQLWLIPLALIVLVSEHINRDRLSSPQATSLRYTGLLLLYVSSTAEMFIHGIGQNLFLPLVLAWLSILGVLAGIVVRVRAFLYTGFLFLLLVIGAMIWHTAMDRDQKWVWWAALIVLGAAIIALFATFEKRRNEVLQMIESIKQWD